MKLAGGNDLREIDTAAFLEQAAEYDRGGDLRDSLIKLRMLFGLTHPLPVARAADLRRWIDDGHYARILGGDYPRREHDSDASVSADAKEAAEEYRRTFARSEDPLMGLLRRFGEGAGSVGEWMGAGAGRVRDWWASGGRAPHLKNQGAMGCMFVLAIIATALLGMSGAVTALGDTLFPVSSLSEGIRQDFSRSAQRTRPKQRGSSAARSASASGRCWAARCWS